MSEKYKIVKCPFCDQEFTVVETTAGLECDICGARGHIPIIFPNPEKKWFWSRPPSMGPVKKAATK